VKAWRCLVALLDNIPEALVLAELKHDKLSVLVLQTLEPLYVVGKLLEEDTFEVPTDEELDAVDLLEARQLLPQRTTRVIGVRPQLGGCACPRDRRLQYHERQQTGRAALERTDRVGDEQRWVVQQAQAHIGRPRAAAGWGQGRTHPVMIAVRLRCTQVQPVSLMR
jgi:hypothetical protein